MPAPYEPATARAGISQFAEANSLAGSGASSLPEDSGRETVDCIACQLDATFVPVTEDLS